MLATMSERQFRTWWAFHLFVEPFESARMDRRFGLLVACIESMLFGADAEYDASRFYLGWREPRSADTGENWRVLQAKFQQLCHAFNGRE